MSTATHPVAIVTGGSRGIGAATVAAFLRRGLAVCLTHTGSLPPDLGDRVDGRRLLAVRADVTDEAAMNRVFAAAGELGRVVALVNNAGITGTIGTFADLDLAETRRVLEVNLLGTIIGCRLAARAWRDDPAGRSIVNVSSVAASLGAPNEYVPYAAAKAGVETLTVGLAKEFGPLGIRVNAVAPGTTDTGIHAAAGEPDRPARVAGRIPFGRVGRPEEVAEAVLWLSSAEASYVSGAVLRVAGGL